MGSLVSRTILTSLVATLLYVCLSFFESSTSSDQHHFLNARSFISRANNQRHRTSTCQPADISVFSFHLPACIYLVCFPPRPDTVSLFWVVSPYASRGFPLKCTSCDTQTLTKIYQSGTNSVRFPRHFDHSLAWSGKKGSAESAAAGANAPPISSLRLHPTNVRTRNPFRLVFNCKKGEEDDSRLTTSTYCSFSPCNDSKCNQSRKRFQRGQRVRFPTPSCMIASKYKTRLSSERVSTLDNLKYSLHGRKKIVSTVETSWMWLSTILDKSDLITIFRLSTCTRLGDSRDDPLFLLPSNSEVDAQRETFSIKLDHFQLELKS